MISYITTSIPYVNARPHLGHALEFVQADVLARHRRAHDHQVRLLTGTDDNAAKNVTAAAAAGADVAEFVRANGEAFIALADRLGISYDDTIRTGSDPRHRPGVERLWRQISGDLYRRSYSGLYCSGCEQFYQPGELSDGRCPEHLAVPEQVTEENWFFALSRYQERIEEAIDSGRVRIQPDHRRAEVLGFLRSGLADISVSRPSSRADGWGIGVPDDPGQTVYVWWEALGNYVTALGFGDDQRLDYRRWWLESDERIHVIGKGITRFHAVIWLGTLLAAAAPLPTRIAVHEYLQLGGRKLSKSTGVPEEYRPETLLDSYGSDAVRWWLTSDVTTVGDTDFTPERLRTRYREDLINTIGNLVNRTVSLTRRAFGGTIADHDHQSADDDLEGATEAARRLPTEVAAALDRFDHRRATSEIVRTAALANAAIETIQPWVLTRRAANGDRAAERRLAAVLSSLLDSCRTIATELEPFVPEGAARLKSALGDGRRVGQAVPAFHQLDKT